MFPATAAVRPAPDPAGLPAQPSPPVYSPATLANQNLYYRALQVMERRGQVSKRPWQGRFAHVV